MLTVGRDGAICTAQDAGRFETVILGSDIL